MQNVQAHIVFPGFCETEWTEMGCPVLCPVFWTVQHCRYIWVSPVKNTSGFHKETQHFQPFLLLLKRLHCLKRVFIQCLLLLFCGFLFLFSFFPSFVYCLVAVCLALLFRTRLFEVNCVSDQVLEYNLYSSCSYGDC